MHICRGLQLSAHYLVIAAVELLSLSVVARRLDQTTTEGHLSGCLTAATTRLRLHALTLANLDIGLVVNGGCTHSLLDLACHGQERLLDVRGVLGGGLKERYAEAVRKLLETLSAMHTRVVLGENSSIRYVLLIMYLGHSVLNDLLISHIALVANQKLVYALGRISVNFLEPLLHVVERIHVRDIVDHTDTMRASVVG